jgi:hypothetical protein
MPNIIMEKFFRCYRLFTRLTVSLLLLLLVLLYMAYTKEWSGFKSH